MSRFLILKYTCSVNNNIIKEINNTTETTLTDENYELCCPFCLSVQCSEL